MCRLSQGMYTGICPPGTDEGYFFTGVNYWESIFNISLNSTPLCLNLPAMKIGPVILYGQLIIFPCQWLNFSLKREFKFMTDGVCNWMNKLMELYKEIIWSGANKKSPPISGGFDIYNLQLFTLTLVYVILQLLERLILIGGHFLPLFYNCRRHTII